MSIQVTKPEEVPQGEYQEIIAYEFIPRECAYLVFQEKDETKAFIAEFKTIEEAKEFYKKWKELK